MAFPDGWGRRCKLTISSTMVSADLASFPLLLKWQNLPAEMLTSGGPNAALPSGGDIRFSTDAAGQNRLPCEVVEFVQNVNPLLAEAQIYVLVPNVSSAVDTSIYVWYKKAGETQPAAGDPFGRNAVWVNYGAVWHLEENNTLGSQTYLDSTGNGNELYSGNDTRTPSRTSGQIRYGQELDDVNNDLLYRSGGTLTNLDLNTFTFSCWIKRTSASGGGFYDRLLSRGNDDRFDISINAENATGNMSFISNGTGATGGWRPAGLNIDDSSWHHISASHASGTTSFLKDGGSKQTHAYTVNHQNRAIGLGCKVASSESLDCVMDEARWSYNTVFSDAYINAEYSNASDSAAFVSAGTPVNPFFKAGFMPFFDLN